MKDNIDQIHASCEIKHKSKFRDLWDKGIHKLKNGAFTCPFCKESFTGLGALGSHIKEHCT
jgi:hypothetical protein